MIKLDITKQLKKSGMSRDSLAREIGVTYQTIDKIYKQKTTSVRFDILDKLCTALNCDIADILIMDKKSNYDFQKMYPICTNNRLYKTISESFYANESAMSLDLFDIYVEAPILYLLKTFEKLMSDLCECGISLVSDPEYKKLNDFAKFLVKGTVVANKRPSEYLEDNGYCENDVFHGNYKDFLLDVKELVKQMIGYEIVIFNPKSLFNSEGVVVSTILDKEE